ncbi:helix-turn-helix domain-containing protein [Paenibacillus sp. CAU 1782]
MKKYSELLKEYIKDSGLTLLEIAEALKEHNFNISKGYISQLQNGKTERPATDELTRALCKVLNADAEKLLTASLIEKAPAEIKEKMVRFYALKELQNQYNATLKVSEANSTYIHHDLQKLPILNSITSIENEQTDEFVYVDMPKKTTRNLFALRVKGDSMIGDLINDGDIVICESVKEVLPDAIAVVSIKSDAASLMRINKQNDLSILIPSNPKYQPAVMPSSETKVWGRVIEVRRKL